MVPYAAPASCPADALATAPIQPYAMPATAPATPHANPILAPERQAARALASDRDPQRPRLMRTPAPCAFRATRFHPIRRAEWCDCSPPPRSPDAPVTRISLRAMRFTSPRIDFHECFHRCAPRSRHGTPSVTLQLAISPRQTAANFTTARRQLAFPRRHLRQPLARGLLGIEEPYGGMNAVLVHEIAEATAVLLTHRAR